MTDNYKTLQALILKSEGKTAKDDLEMVIDDKNQVGTKMRDITLDRVLMALGKVLEQDFNCGINGNSLNISWIFDDCDTPCGVEPKSHYLGWELCKPLHEQPEKSLIKLIEILK